jgi:hypothetical protein
MDSQRTPPTGIFRLVYQAGRGLAHLRPHRIN